MGIILKSEREIALMRRAGGILGTVLQELKSKLRPGMKTAELDILADSMLRKMGAEPSFKGYRGFPASVCVSINEEIVHGIPGERVLKEGDIVSLDIGVRKNGWYGDAARTFAVGKISPEAQRLLEITERALAKGISRAREGGRLSDISAAIEQEVKGNGFSVVRALVGHGIGRELHEDPQVPNYGRPGEGARLEEGMALAIEPMVNLGAADVVTLADQWTVVTADRKLSAHFEHTVAIGADGPEILSRIEAS